MSVCACVFCVYSVFGVFGVAVTVCADSQWNVLKCLKLFATAARFRLPCILRHSS